MRHCFSRRAKLLKATATNYKHACTTTQYTLVTVKTLSSKAQSKLGSLLSSPSCRKLLSQVSKTPALAENFCSKPKRPATNQILLRTAKTSQDCRKLRKQLGSRGFLIAQHLQLRCSHFHTVRIVCAAARPLVERGSCAGPAGRPSRPRGSIPSGGAGPRGS